MHLFHSLPFHKILEKANLENYLLEDSRQHLEFDNGMKVDLLSLNELAAFGMEVDAAVRQRTPKPLPMPMGRAILDPEHFLTREAAD